MTRTTWLHGWPQIDAETVLMGAAVHCAGCGREHGLTCVAISPNHRFPEKNPDWPFDEGNCPVCAKHQERKEPTLRERLAAFKAAKMTREPERFSAVGGFNFSRERCTSQCEIYIHVYVDGEPPAVGERGPGIKLYANDEQQARAMFDWVISKLGAEQ